MKSCDPVTVGVGVSSPLILVSLGVTRPRVSTRRDPAVWDGRPRTFGDVPSCLRLRFGVPGANQTCARDDERTETLPADLVHPVVISCGGSHHMLLPILRFIVSMPGMDCLTGHESLCELLMMDTCGSRRHVTFIPASLS